MGVTKHPAVRYENTLLKLNPLKSNQRCVSFPCTALESMTASLDRREVMMNKLLLDETITIFNEGHTHLWTYEQIPTSHITNRTKA